MLIRVVEQFLIYKQQNAINAINLEVGEAAAGVVRYFFRGAAGDLFCCASRVIFYFFIFIGMTYIKMYNILRSYYEII